MTEFLISDTHYSSFNVVFRQNSNRLQRAGLVPADTVLVSEKTDANFELVDQLDQVMLENWNNRVEATDTVYFLGDLAILRNPAQWSEWLAKLNGKKVFVVGNHDQSRVLKYATTYPKTNIIEVVTTAKLIKRNHQELWLTHYPTLLSSRMINVHGHIHARTIESMLVKPEDGGDIEHHRFFNVGVDSHDMAFLPIGVPISMEELLERAKK